MVPEPLLGEAARRFAVLGDPNRPGILSVDPTLVSLRGLVCGSLRSRAEALAGA